MQLRPVQSALRPTESVDQRLQRAWTRHPVVAFFRHRSQVAFYRQLHALMRSGAGMPIALGELGRYAPPRLKQALAVVRQDLDRGQGLGEALRKHPVFEDTSIELIAFAEQAGTLDDVLATLIRHLEEVQKLRWRAIFLALWPMYLAAGFVVVGPLFGVAGASSLDDGLARYVAGLVRNMGTALALVGFVFGWPFLIAALGQGSAWDRFKLRAPLFGGALRDLVASRLVLGLGLGVGAGLEVVRAIRLAARAAGNAMVLDQLPAAEARLAQGGTFTEAVETLNVLDSTNLGLLSVAERTGTLDETLKKLSEDLQEAAIRALRLVMLAVVAVVAVVLLVLIVSKLLGTLFGPVMTLDDAAGSGKLDG